MIITGTGKGEKKRFKVENVTEQYEEQLSLFFLSSFELEQWVTKQSVDAVLRHQLLLKE